MLLKGELRWGLSLCVCFLSFVTLMISCDKKTDQYEISGKIENVEGEYFYISHEIGDSIHVDTIPINPKGEFTFRGDVDTLTIMSLYFNNNTKSTFALVNKGWKVELKGDVVYPDLIDVKGGDVNDDLTAFKNQNRQLLKTRADILNAAEERINESDSSSLRDYVGDLKNVNFELSNVAAAYIKTNPDKIASVMLLNIFFRDENTIPRLNENLLYLRGKAADFPLTEELKRFRDKVKMSSVSSMAPFFSLKNLKGKEVKLQDFKGKYVLLTFVSTTCEICREEKPEAIKIYNQLKKEKKNIEFITIVKDTEQLAVSENISDSVKWNILPVYGGWSAKTFSDYYIREIPYSILIAPTGYILERDIHIQALAEKLDELTGEKTKK